MHTIDQFCKLGKAVIAIEAQAIRALDERINSDFTQACHYLLGCEGRIIVIGMGKSGHIAKKIAATFASTGSPAFFVHPGEASHGDLGMITAKDVVLAISYSGKSDEITTILPLIKRLDIPLIGLTGYPNSPLAQAASVHLNVSVEQEACPLGLAPTASTTATLAMGDALAIALLDARGFTSEDFALSHPGGSLGRRLLLRVETIMNTGDEIPAVSKETPLSQALIEMTQKSLGMTTVVNDNFQLLGVFTDGDLRRTLDQKIDINSLLTQEVMNTNCKTIAPETLAVEALSLMENYKITSLVVVDENNKVIGILHMHALLRANVI